MRLLKRLLICICCVMTVPAVWGQAANSQAHHGILGYLDPQTGAFRLIPPANDSEEFPASTTTFTGTINLTITVTLKTSGLTNIVCSAETTVEDALTTSPRSFIEQDTVAATGTGTKTCKLSIPYSWALATQSSDSMSTSYTVTGSGSTAGAPPIRSSSLSPVDTRKVPANGATTTLTASVTL